MQYAPDSGTRATIWRLVPPRGQAVAAVIHSRIGFDGHADLPFTLPAISAGKGMGDFRNKYAKMARDERVKALQAALEGRRPPASPLRCRCGLTYHQVPVLWAVQADRWSPLEVYCPACLPPDLLGRGL